MYLWGGKGAILLRYYCVSCHLSVFEVGLDIYYWNRCLRNKSLGFARVNMSEGGVIGSDGYLAIVIADIPLENFFCYYWNNRYSYRWPGYVGSVERSGQGGRSGSKGRDCMCWGNVLYESKWNNWVSVGSGSVLRGVSR